MASHLGGSWCSGSDFVGRPSDPHAVRSVIEFRQTGRKDPRKPRLPSVPMRPPLGGFFICGGSRADPARQMQRRAVVHPRVIRHPHRDPTTSAMPCVPRWLPYGEARAGSTQPSAGTRLARVVRSRACETDAESPRRPCASSGAAPWRRDSRRARRCDPPTFDWPPAVTAHVSGARTGSVPTGSCR